jgi:putative colanic acid biosynthesis acetyltransferase WcaF
MAWFLIGLPLLRCSLIPFSGLRVWLLKLFGAEIGERVVVKPGVRVKYPWHLRIGQDCWIGEDCWIDNLTTVRIGNDVCLSQGAYLCTGNHSWTDPAFGLVIEPILIQNGAWVGAKAFLGPGVVLGHGAIAAAGSVVSKNIPDFKIHAGNPAVFVRNRLIGASKPATEQISTKERVTQ